MFLLLTLNKYLPAGMSEYVVCNGNIFKIMKIAFSCFYHRKNKCQDTELRENISWDVTVTEEYKFPRKSNKNTKVTFCECGISYLINMTSLSSQCLKNFGLSNLNPVNIKVRNMDHITFFSIKHALFLWYIRYFPCHLRKVTARGL